MDSVSSSQVESLHVDKKETSLLSDDFKDAKSDVDSAGNPQQQQEGAGQVESEQPQQTTLSVTEVTDNITNKLNELLMELNRSDKAINKVLKGVEKRLDSLQSKIGQ